MSCKEIEQRIYLYGELNEAEQAETDRHIKGCKDCIAVFETHERQRVHITRIAIHTPRIRNSAALTSKIMQQIKPNVTRTERLTVKAREGWLKISFAAVSAALVLMFVQEQQIEPVATKVVQQNGTVLNTNLFRLHHQQTRSKKGTSMYERLTYQRNITN